MDDVFTEKERAVIQRTAIDQQQADKIADRIRRVEIDELRHGIARMLDEVCPVRRRGAA